MRVLLAALAVLLTSCGSRVGVVLVSDDLRAADPEKALTAAADDAEVLGIRLSAAGVRGARVRSDGDSLLVTLKRLDDLGPTDYLAARVGRFEFRMVEDLRTTFDLLKTADEFLGNGRRARDSDSLPLLALVLEVGGEFGILAVDSAMFVRNLLESRTVLPADCEFLLGPKEEHQGNSVQRVYCVRSEPPMPIHGFNSTAASRYLGGDPRLVDSWVVNLQLSTEDVVAFAQLTESSMGRRIAMTLDGVVLSAPVVQARIPDGRMMVVNGNTQTEAQMLAAILESGPTRARWTVAKVSG